MKKILIIMVLLIVFSLSSLVNATCDVETTLVEHNSDTYSIDSTDYTIKVIDASTVNGARFDINGYYTGYITVGKSEEHNDWKITVLSLSPGQDLMSDKVTFCFNVGEEDNAIVCNPTCEDKFYCKEYPAGNQCEPESDDACQDSDGGIDEYTGGIATGAGYGSATRRVAESKDYCLLAHGGGVAGKDGRLREQYCKDGLIYSVDIDCDYGCEYGESGSYCKQKPASTPQPTPTPTVSKDFEERFMLLNQKDKNAIENFKNTITLDQWHTLINHGRFRVYYALRDWLGDSEFEEKYSDNTIDFKNFPHIFNYGGTFNGVVVVGSSATDKEKEAARYIYNSLNQFFSPPTNWPMDPIMTDNDLGDDWIRNVITIGSPCSNAVTAKVTHVTDCDSDLQIPEDALKLYDHDGFAQLAVVAASDDDLMDAAKYLVEHLNNMNPAYRDENFNGNEIIKGTCDGCFSRPDCIDFFARIDGKYCDSDKKIKAQKQAGDSCQKGYECLYNICKNNVCKPYCEGCYDSNDNCVPIGTRDKDTFCEATQEMLNQKQEDSACNNNYECKSNVCVNDKCISPSLIQKIIDWFKNLFG
jgi:hypothetical protein